MSSEHVCTLMVSVCVSSGPWESSDLRGKRRGKSELSNELIKTSGPSASIGLIKSEKLSSEDVCIYTASSSLIWGVPSVVFV